MSEERSIPISEIQPGPIQPGPIQPGPIQHSEIPEVLQPALRWTYRHLGRHIQPTYEQWELGFMRDINMIQEITHWVAMTWAFREFLAIHPDCEEQLVLSGVAAIGLGVVLEQPINREFAIIAELKELIGSVPPEFLDLEDPVYEA